MTGAVLSMVTADESVVAVTAVPELAARSEKAMLSEARPSGSAPLTVSVALQVSPETRPTEAERPARVTVGVLMASLAVKVSVRVSPSLAQAGLELSDEIETAVTVRGGVPPSWPRGGRLWADVI